MFDYKSKNPNIDIKTGFYNRSFFDLRLCEERRRTERSGLPFSVLTMDISDVANSVNGHPIPSLLKIKKSISAIIQGNCRSSDIKTWYTDTTLKILLPETSLKDAHVFSEKLHKIFNNGFMSSLGTKKSFDLKKRMMIHSAKVD